MIIDILQTFNWTYVSIVYPDTAYGTMLFAEMAKLMKENGYCFQTALMIPTDQEMFDYSKAVQILSKKSTAHVVILALFIKDVRKLFVEMSKYWNNNFTWIAANDIGANANELLDVQDVAYGLLAITRSSSPVPRFDQYFQSLTLRSANENPWFGEFFGKAFNCDYQTKNSCNWDTPISHSPYYKPETTVSLSIDAVYAIAHALKTALGNCSDQMSFHQCVEGSKLRDSLSKVNFEGEEDYFGFEENGSKTGSYNLFNVYFNNNKTFQTKVGHWNSTTRNFTFFRTVSFPTFS